MKPQLITFGSPSPRNASADSMRIAVATMSEPVTMIGERVFGRISRKMIRRSFIPSTTHACTNSRFRIAMNSPRTSRVMGGHVTAAIANTIFSIRAERIATRTIAKMNDGMVWKNSVMRMRTSSIQPP